jgi:hypothetical protein
MGLRLCCLILREEYRLSAFGNRVLKRLLGLKNDKMLEVGENVVTESCVIYAFCQV